MSANGPAATLAATALPKLTPLQICMSSSAEKVTAAFERLGKSSDPKGCLDASKGTDAAAEVVAEQVIHLLDAWRYFSAAVNAFLSNSMDNATHFAYYAELRSAISLFAGNGIRVKFKEEYLIDANGIKQPFNVVGGTRTHTFVWELWEQWISCIHAKNLMGRDIKLRQGLALEDLANVPSGAPMLQAWGYDFFRFAKDHEARNKASYHAKASEALVFMDQKVPDLIQNMWSLLLLGAHGILFDTALVRYFVQKMIDDEVFTEAQQGNKLDPKVVLSAIVSGTASQTIFDEATIQAMFDEPVDTQLFDLAADEIGEPANVLCRAFFLLRFATLSVSRNLAATSSIDCQKWIRTWLAHTGLLDPVASDAADLEADYREALDEFDISDGSLLPSAMWSSAAAAATALLTRTEGFLGWGLPV